MKKALIFITVLSTMALGAAAQKKAAKPKMSKEDKEFLSKQPDGLYAKLETNRGNIYTQLEFQKMPMTVANFVGLAEGGIKNKARAEGKPYYDSIKFHRVIPGFMIQGGDPNGNGSGDPGYSFDDEMDGGSDLAKNGYKRGVLAMANRGPNTNGSQFFLMHKDYGLPPSYTIFGHVVQGIEVVDSIAASPRAQNDMPLKDQLIKHIQILRKGKEAEAFNAPVVFESAKANMVKVKEERQKAAMEAVDKELKEKYADAKTTASGLRYIMVTEGTGATPTISNNIVINYSGVLLGGTQPFDATQPGKPADYPLNRMIMGWQEGLQLMKAGGKIKLIVPPNLGYGERGYPGVIPPNSWLVFDVELLEVK